MFTLVVNVQWLNHKCSLQFESKLLLSNDTLLKTKWLVAGINIDFWLIPKVALTNCHWKDNIGRFYFIAFKLNQRHSVIKNLKNDKISITCVTTRHTLHIFWFFFCLFIWVILLFTTLQFFHVMRFFWNKTAIQHTFLVLLGCNSTRSTHIYGLGLQI